MRSALVKVAFFRTPRSLGVENALGKFEVLRDVGKEDKVLLEIRGLRLAPTGEMVSLIWGSGAELEVRWDTFGLPAVGSGIFMKLPALASFSFVFLGACGFPEGVNVVAERFTGFGVAMSFRPTRGVRGAGERCLLTVVVRWREPEFELLSLAFMVGLDVLLERSFGTASACFIFNFDA
jgi:hypothetical protein